MKALVRQGGVTLAEAPEPAGEVLVRVRFAGICRTDLYVADGRLPVREPRILGHEASGVVVSGGALPPGTPVAINPVLSCAWVGRVPCAACRAERPCADAEMLGVERDGAFAEVVGVPAAAVVALPPGVPLAHAAMAEPVAASLAVLRAPLERGTRGAVLGSGRIAELTTRVLAEAGFTPIPWNTELRDLAWVVETAPQHLDAALAAVAPGGVVVLKSRPAEACALDVARAVKKEVTLVGRSYGRFADAVSWLARLQLGDFVGETFPLEGFDAAFSVAREDERRKVFFEV